jgi:hypothetical protein
MGGFEMLGPSIGRELVRAKLDGLYAEAARDGRTRRLRESRRPRGLRLSLGMRLVSAGYRLLGDPVEAR